ncbi:hypothetical protein [Terribacillus saccharophilus]|uniref:Uncharacterized protein n=1 Tax=Terribacillus saccharophilus TaxID=361277 RepID=A0A268A863_9BACI|nr:hypothetical protein [Terribacillus saccharophilus]PAD20308.1 hypothetical protein CHH64_14580 [Terribacillus saccharophilus]PAF18252.1 hypothetical protein CHH51_08125 [Terribacillus saccharophilus]PAF20753.1 hypothetical protein CHH49_14550 [Terribacillus saccharophilus]PAF35855.1 hypothetical protein CHH58_14815 [Terribacillus saccharophilus]PAF40010.1 hypothetical protein CHH69_05280 [Terribacillus saccharophilus]
MKAWLALVKKEFRVGLPIMLLAIVLFLVGLVVVTVSTYRFGYAWDAVGIIGLAWGGGHFFFMAIYMLYSLGVERKRLHLWLHNPMHASGLLAAKLVTGTVYMIISLLIVSIAAYVGGLNFVAFSDGTWFKIGMIAFVHVIALSIDFSVYVILAYVVFLLLGRYMSSFLSGTVVFIGWWVFVYLYFGLFSQSQFYTAISEWGRIDLGFVANSLHFDISITEALINMQGEEMSIYVGYYIVELITILIIYFIASWLLDKKVEV